MVHESYLPDAAYLSRFKTIVLPNIACLSEAQCGGLKAFVKAGGGLLADFETSLYDEKGNKKGNFGLSDLFGVDLAGDSETLMKNSYLHLHLETEHPVLKGFYDTMRTVNGDSRVPVKENAPFPAKPVTLIPAYPDLPMEEVYPRQDLEDRAELYLRAYGQGRTAYFTWDIHRGYWDLFTADHLRLFTNAVDWLTQEDRLVRLEGQGSFDIAVWQQEKSVTVHLINMTNPMYMQAPVREIIPSPPQELSVNLPEGAAVKGITLLSTGRKPVYKLEGRTLSLAIPPFPDHEVIAVDIEPISKLG
jgi:hypothetical protein